MDQQSLTVLLTMKPNEICLWIGAHAESADMAGFNWVGLAEIARQRAVQSNNALPELLAWGHVAEEATTAAKKLGGHAFSLDSSMMRFRALLVKRFGFSKDESLLSPDPFIDWFHSLTAASPAEVATTARDWKSLPPEQVLSLRHIKTGIAVLQSACSEHNPAPDSAVAALVEQWRPVAALLP